MIPKVSVIIPVYNSENYIAKCINSLVKQTLKEIEIIIINDGSTDNSAEICNKYALTDSRIKIINKKNEGQGIARNIGINAAQGEFLGFVDSDDIVSADYYEELYKNAKKYDADTACGSFTKLFPNGHEEIYGLGLYLNKKIKILETTDEKKYLIYTNSFCDKIVKRELFIKNDIKFYENGIFEDTPVGLEIALTTNKAVYVPNVCYYYVHQKNSTMHNMSNKTFGIFDVLQCINLKFNSKYKDIPDFQEYKQLLFLRDVRQLFYFIFATEKSSRNKFLLMTKNYIKSNKIKISQKYSTTDINFRYLIINVSDNAFIFVILAYIYYFFNKIIGNYFVKWRFTNANQ